MFGECLRPASRDFCVICKGTRMLCGLDGCPILRKLAIQAPKMAALKEEIFGPTPPGIFVGHSGYPSVFWGPMISMDDAPGLADDPGRWFGLDFDDIIRFRSSLIRSMKRGSVHERNRLLEKAQEAILSTKPVDAEMRFSKKPRMELRFNPDLQPMGPSAPLKEFRLCENPKVPRKTDEIVDEGMKATDAICELYAHGLSIYYLTKLLSAGLFGRVERRKLVPTKWSITATDDILAKDMMKRIRGFTEINSFLIYSSQYLSNHFEILLIPGKWEYENFEAWSPGTLWTEGLSGPKIIEEYEPYYGRTTYAEEEGGGYYAARFSVCEALVRMRRQARVVVFREVYEGYMMPVGVWEVRENVRNALRKHPKRFSTLGEALSYLNGRLRIPIREYIRRSRILSQRRIPDYLSQSPANLSTILSKKLSL